MSRFAEFHRADELFRGALELPAGEREAFLERECGDDGALRATVAELLESAEEDGQLVPGGALASPVWKSLAGAATNAVIGERMGPYRIVEEIGRGGMAVVYLAERADGAFEGRAALKLLRRGRATDEIEQRFLRERQILARLRHPHIAQLLDGGTSASGQPFLAMEQVDGEPIDRFCDRRRLSIEERLRLFRKVCAVVQFAHRNLVVHRDLKPSNILVSEDGDPKLLDFGIAKLLEPDPAGGELTQTAMVDRILTPQYASPEQVLGEPVSTATDVYALGLLLYELLTGRRARGLASSRPSEIERAVCGEEPSAPSSVVLDDPPSDGTGSPPSAAELAAARRLTPGRLRGRLRGDLDTVVAMALRREPERRYASVEQLADDVLRHLEGRPVLAHRPSLLYRARKLAVRRSGTLAAAAVVVLALVAGIVATSRQARRAEQEARRAEEVAELLTTLLEDADPDRSQGRDVTVREVLDRAARSLEHELGSQPRLQASLQAVIGRVYARLGLAEKAGAQLGAALERRRALLGPDHPEVAATAARLALVRLDEGRREEAEELARESLGIRRRRFGDDAPELAESLVTLGQVRYERGAIEEGRELLRRAIALLDDGEAGSRRRLADALHTAARIELEAGEPELSEEHARREVALRRALGAPMSRDLALALHTLASALQIRGSEEQVGEAVSALEEAIEIERALLGESHPWTANLLADLAGARARLGDFAGGEQSYREALETATAALGPDHPFVALLDNNIAVFYHRQRRWPQAIEFYRRSVELRERVLEPNHPLIGTTRAYLGLALHQAGDPRAEETYRAALAELEASLGPEHEKVGNLRADYGRLLAEQGRYAEAEPQLAAALAIVRPVFGDDDQRTDSARSGLGLVLCGLGRPDEGEPMLEASREWRETRYPEGHWRRAEIGLYEAECALRRGQYAGALGQIDRALERLAEGENGPLVRLAKRLRAGAP